MHKRMEPKAIKKGTARLAMSAWEQGISLQIIPLGINYNSFTNFGKNIILNFGNIITKQNIALEKEETEGKKIQTFNAVLKTNLENLVIQSKPVDKKFIATTFNTKENNLKKILLFIPALFAYILHAALYIPVQKFAFKKFGKIDHYDSVMVAMLLLLYPIYLLLIACAVFFIWGSYWWLATFSLFPFTAWAYISVKNSFNT